VSALTALTQDNGRVSRTAALFGLQEVPPIQLETYGIGGREAVLAQRISRWALQK